MKNFLVVVVLLIVAAGTGTAYGELSTNTGNDLASVCSEGDKRRNPDEYLKAGMCRGFIIGVYSAEDDICPGVNVTNGQIFKIVRKYLDEHPEELDAPSQKLIHSALFKAFPCARK